MTREEAKTAVDSLRAKHKAVREAQKLDNKAEWAVIAEEEKHKRYGISHELRAKYDIRKRKQEEEANAIMVQVREAESILESIPRTGATSDAESWNGKKISAMATAHICNAIDLNIRFCKTNPSEVVARKQAITALLAELIERVSMIDNVAESL